MSKINKKVFHRADLVRHKMTDCLGVILQMTKTHAIIYFYDSIRNNYFITHLKRHQNYDIVTNYQFCYCILLENQIKHIVSCEDV